ncbi:helix-turn-helix domain-containing protein [Streptomyces sp. NPDC057697]|uniref:helix-turn-helix domain-containing protein n=1 Tax=Streptomyces sp. NPDC057697 TaxID=3346219 RepID=UPI003683E8B5
MTELREARVVYEAGREADRVFVMRNAVVMSEESERLAKALIEFREAEGISVRELAHRTQLSQATIRLHESERGCPPLPFAARRLEEALGWTPGSIPTEPRETADIELPPDSSAVPE